MRNLTGTLLALYVLILPVIPAGAEDFREEMRQFVQHISEYARTLHPGFIVIPQNGQELITKDGEPGSPLAAEYLAAIDGSGREDLFYGYKRDNRKTPESDRAYLLTLCRLFEEQGKTVLVTDYCKDPAKMDDSYTLNGQQNFISFAAPRRDLTLIPGYPEKVYRENPSDITTLADARNFLYLINGEEFSSRSDFVEALSTTNYDLVIMDLFQAEESFTPRDLDRIRLKKNGGKRLLICYMSIGEAEDYRFYWRREWAESPPPWLEKENPRWKGNYKVRYWDPLWQSLIFGSRESYLDRILAAGFDGVYLDIIDGFEYFE